MKCEIPLTPEQRLFAAEHHDLVYKFEHKGLVHELPEGFQTGRRQGHL